MADDGETFRTTLENRDRVLRSLRESPATKPALVSELRTSRSTIDRAIRELIEQGCVAEQDGTYAPTKTGRLALAEHERYRERTRSIRRSSELLNYLPEDAEIAPALLDGASITIAEPHAPEAATVRGSRLLERATVLKGLAPVATASHVYTINEQLEREELTVEVVAKTEVVDTLSEFVSAPVDALLERESLSLYRTDAELPYALWLMETPTGEHAGITVYESGSVAGMLVNDADPAVRWARTRYREYRKRAQPVANASV